MREKLKSSRGETLVEVLASVLVCALSIALLFGAVTSSTNIDLQAQKSDAEYYEALTKAERREAGDEVPPELTLSVVVTNAVSPLNPQPETPVDCVFYGTDQLLSYTVTGGGG